MPFNEITQKGFYYDLVTNIKEITRNPENRILFNSNNDADYAITKLAQSNTSPRPPNSKGK